MSTHFNATECSSNSTSRQANPPTRQAFSSLSAFNCEQWHMYVSNYIAVLLPVIATLAMSCNAVTDWQTNWGNFFFAVWLTQHHIVCTPSIYLIICSTWVFLQTNILLFIEFYYNFRLMNCTQLILCKCSNWIANCGAIKVIDDSWGKNCCRCR